MTRSEWVDEGDGVLAYWIEADAFMRHMVRVAGRHDARGGLRALRPWTTSRACWRAARAIEAGDTAPAHGLYLEHVYDYPR